MTNQELWPIGTRVRFDYDSLQASGIVYAQNNYSVTVRLDDLTKGWNLSDINRRIGRGWDVPYSYLERVITKTKLGNSL